MNLHAPLPYRTTPPAGGGARKKRRLHASLLLLAGGKGLRMGGKNKLYLELEGSLLIERTLRSLSPLFDETILLVAPGESGKICTTFAPLIEKWRLRLVEDSIPGRGPLEGLMRGLTEMNSDWGFLLGCDMPSVNSAVVNGMYDFCSDDADAVTAELHGFIEPLHAFYRRSCCDSIQKALSLGDRKIKSIYKEINLLVLKEELLRSYGNCEESFFNLNSPGDIDKMKKYQEVNSR